MPGLVNADTILGEHTHTHTETKQGFNLMCTEASS